MDRTNFSIFLIDNQAYIIAFFFLFFFLVQLIYYLGIYSRVAFFRKKQVPSLAEPVSVIICARNEADNLEKYLPAVLSQQYPEFEVIVVDDASSDETETLLKRFTAQYPHLRTTTIRADKKFARQEAGRDHWHQGSETRHPGFHRCRL